MNKQDEGLITLGALLHDIGKARERTFQPLPDWARGEAFQAKYSHEPFSALFVDEWMSHWPTDQHTLRRLVLKHHDPSLYDELLVSLADRLSANERAEAEGNEEGARGRAESVLRSVLSRVRLEGRGADEIYHKLLALSLNRQVLMPGRDESGSAEAYQTLWQAFTNEVTRVPPGDIPTLLAVLRKYTWAIPSDTRYKTIPDISLYHHLKTTAAIAACLVRARLEEREVQTLYGALSHRYFKQPSTPTEDELVNRPLCALAKGDISGTQDFLYLLTSSGAARGLRGRSFYLQLLTEVIAAWILRQFALPMTNLLFAGGGHFYLLLPYRETAERFDNLRQQISQRLWKAHKGDLSLTVDYVPVAAVDFLEHDAGGNAFAHKWDEVSRRVNERKQRKWRELDGNEMMLTLFTAQQLGTTAEEMCQVCHGEWRQGRDEMDDGIRKCRRCYQFEGLGQLLREPTYLVLFTVPEREPPDPWDWRGVLQAFGVFPWLVHEGEDVPEKPNGATGALVYTFHTSGPLDFLTDEVKARFRWGDMPVSFDSRLLADATPMKRESNGELVIAEFSDLAEASEGVKWLGVLRMDVDSLGDVFKKGLGNNATISRMTTLSESLRLFFEGWVPQLCQQYNPVAQGSTRPENKDALYLIYAGGDDLFVVGAWSVLPKLAQQIRDDFREFVGGDHITLSGGIAIEHQKFPLYQLANNAKYALDDQAKEHTRTVDGRSVKKDALSFLQTPLGWERFNEIAERQDELRAMLRGDGGTVSLPRAFLTRLSEIHSLYEENRQRQRHRMNAKEITLAQMEEEIAYAKWVWRLVYHLSRFGERYTDHQDKIRHLQQAIARDRDGLISVLHVLARWTSLLTREG
ncbi:MAG: type III-A CRISPR-associated protein Cas10/Csm1 [Acidobacteriota bacterium]|nr:type III-A CRISPR-associated protein Cas10/Csm1 [Blastocatellia bacterium]MDW8238331.1 type III-A CRISPR-associated protein Cas10/Csm1 [Acidobacteriota bacterium]